MNKTYTIDKEFLFNTTIYEISSISIDHNYDIIEGKIEGEFNISGDYRLHEISINKDDFSFKVPVLIELDNNINLDTVELDITDFTYELVNQDELHVHIDYVVTGEENQVITLDEEDLDEFLSNNRDVEVIDFSSDEEVSNKPADIVKSIKTDDSYVKYHIHVVSINDTLESICAKYNVSVNTIKKYNLFDNLELNQKLLIPENEED